MFTNELYILDMNICENVGNYLWLLTQEELDKVNAYARIKDKNNFIFRRAALKLLISEKLNCAPNKIIFSYNKYGKPYLNDHIFFSISFYQDIAVIAISQIEQIGCDVVNINEEKYNPKELKYFSPQEQLDINKAANKNRHFVKLWSAKEAYTKALGFGLSYNFANFTTIFSLKDPIKIEDYVNWQTWFLNTKNILKEKYVTIATKNKSITKSYLSNLDNGKLMTSNFEIKYDS